MSSWENWSNPPACHAGVASSSLAGGAQIIMKGVIGMKRKHDEKEIESDKCISAGDVMVA